MLNRTKNIRLTNRSAQQLFVLFKPQL